MGEKNSTLPISFSESMLARYVKLNASSWAISMFMIFVEG
jgi:hypothetical protein